MAERALREEDIVLPAGPPGAVELGLQVNATLLRRAPEALALAFSFRMSAVSASSRLFF